MKNQEPGVLYKHNHTNYKDSNPSCLQKTSSTVQSFLERVFYRLGCIIGQYPFPTIAICLVLTGVFGAGLTYFYQETQPGKLWVPADSLAQEHLQWIEDNYPADYLRFQSLIVEADNVLDPSVLSAIFEIDQKVKAIDKGDGVTWENLCARLGSECWTNSIFEVWSFDSAVIAELSSDGIVTDINSVDISPVYQVEFKVARYLGGVTKDNSGRIVAAKAAYLRYVLKSNDSIQNELEEGNVKARLFEEDFLKIGEEGHSGVKAIYYNAERSRPEVGTGAIFGDLNLLFAGFVLIIVFVALALGKFNMVHQRIFLAISGVMCVGFAALVSVGIASYADVFFGPLHNILPFLLLGIGVDDMFVIIQAWEVTKAQTEDLPMHERIGKMMKNAGVSITVTSLTDILAFGIGATTKIPALRSFCIYACIGILAIYLYQATFFVACVTLDNRRASAYRNACCCCYVHKKNYEVNECSKQEFVQRFFDTILGKVLTRIPVKILVILLAAGLFAPAVYGVTQLEQDFDPDWFIPPDSYLSDYLKANDRFFPEASSVPASVYLGKIDYYEAFPKLVQLHKDMESSDAIQSGSVLSWYYFFDVWLRASGETVSSTGEFYDQLSVFLYGEPGGGETAQGAAFLRYIVFNDTDSTNPRHIVVSKVQYEHTSLENAAAEIEAMEEMRSLTSGLELDDVFPYSFFYLVWDGNKVIRDELFRNIGLAFLCVFIMTLILIAHPWTCILVCVCVIATLVDVAGLIYFWGLTIDTVTSINLILAVGLAVDYAAHIGHAFMTVRGSRNERTMATLSRMGPAVFYGGFSTFLAFILMAGSNSYVFTVFFRIFLGVVLFGLFQGLIFLPVLLSLMGPAPYLTQEEIQKNSAEKAQGGFDEIPRENVNGVPTPDRIFQGSMVGAATLNSGFLGDGTPNVDFPPQSPNSHDNNTANTQGGGQSKPLPWMFYQEVPARSGTSKQQQHQQQPSSPWQLQQNWPGHLGPATHQQLYPQWSPNYQQPLGGFTAMPSSSSPMGNVWTLPPTTGGPVVTNANPPGRPSGKARKRGDNKKGKGNYRTTGNNAAAGYYGNGYYPGMANNGYSMSLDRFYR